MLQTEIYTNNYPHTTQNPQNLLQYFSQTQDFEKYPPSAASCMLASTSTQNTSQTSSEPQDKSFMHQQNLKCGNFQQSLNQTIKQDIRVHASQHQDKIIPLKIWYQENQQTLSNHLTAMMKCDKYLRLITSVMKTYRAFEPKTSLNKLYKEIVLSRRVIRWESKYDTLIDLLTADNPLPMTLFKLFQLTGDFTDLAAFWLKVKHQGTKKCQRLIQSLEQLQSDFYFLECCIWLCVYCYRVLTAKTAAKGSSEEDRKAESKHNENKLKAAKYLLDVLSSYNNSGLKRRLGEINPKLAGLFTFISSCIGMHILWR